MVWFRLTAGLARFRYAHHCERYEPANECQDLILLAVKGISYDEAAETPRSTSSANASENGAWT